MKIWYRLKKLSIKQLLNLGVVFIQRPLLIRPTLKATSRTMSISQEEFGNAQHKNGTPNAFRHALWNILLAKAAYTTNETTATNWAEQVTTLHEKLAPNAPLETVMDLHNNMVGRQFFSETLNFSETELIQFLKEKSSIAKQITKVEDVERYPNELVYI
jgi:hypothetical protein